MSGTMLFTVLFNVHMIDRLRSFPREQKVSSYSAGENLYSLYRPFESCRCLSVPSYWISSAASFPGFPCQRCPRTKRQSDASRGHSPIGSFSYSSPTNQNIFRQKDSSTPLPHTLICFVFLFFSPPAFIAWGTRVVQRTRLSNYLIILSALLWLHYPFPLDYTDAFTHISCLPFSQPKWMIQLDKIKL